MHQKWEWGYGSVQPETTCHLYGEYHSRLNSKTNLFPEGDSSIWIQLQFQISRIAENALKGIQIILIKENSNYPELLNKETTTSFWVVGNCVVSDDNINKEYIFVEYIKFSHVGGKFHGTHTFPSLVGTPA